MRHCGVPTTLHTDSPTIFHVLLSGKGVTIRSNKVLQKLFGKLFVIKALWGRTLFAQWVPSPENLADPLSQEVLAT
jgi:hypothetical protein